MLTTSEFIALKAQIKAEMLRRNSYGSLAAYGGSDYDFTNTPTSGNPIYTEQGQKIVDLALLIKDIDGMANVKKGDVIPRGIDNLADIFSTYATESMYSSTSS